jgi:diacylglycerol kinase family enzyme
MARRLAAVAALACGFGAIVVALGAALGDEALTGTAAAACAAVSVAGLWVALSRRGVPRIIGVVVAVAGAGALVVVLLSGEHNGLAVALVVALVVAAGASARYALGRDAQTLRTAPVQGTPVGRAAHPVLLVNPRSGDGAAARVGLIDACTARGITALLLEAGDDIVQLAERAIDDGADVIGVAGGDGSQGLVAGVAVSRDVPYVCVPAGTRNHFALDLGLDRTDVVGALDAFVDGVERRVDVATVNGRMFVNNAAMGLYAHVVQSEGYRQAKVGTTLGALPELLGPDAEALDLRYSTPDGVAHTGAHIVLVSNDPYELDRLAGRGTRARLDAGALGVAVLQVEGAAQAVAFVGLQVIGRTQRFRGLTAWTAPRFVVDSGAPIEIGIDGEALVMDAPLEFATVPGALRVRLPQHAPGLAPAAAAAHLSSSTFHDLLAVVTGRSAT